MSALGEMMRYMESGDGSSRESAPMTDEDLAAFRKSFVHLDLKPGDKVRWKKAYKDKRIPEYGEVVEVFSVFTPVLFQGDGGGNHFLDENNFSIAYKDEDGDMFLYAFDSRRFEKV